MHAVKSGDILGENIQLGGTLAAVSNIVETLIFSAHFRTEKKHTRLCHYYLLLLSCERYSALRTVVCLEGTVGSRYINLFYTLALASQISRRAFVPGPKGTAAHSIITSQ